MFSVSGIRPLTATSAKVLPAEGKIFRLIAGQPYTISSYGGENQKETNHPNSAATKEREHPGPPPPNVSKSGEGGRDDKSPPSASTEQGGSDTQPASDEQRQSTPQIPSNNAHPTLTDGRQSPYVDNKGDLLSDVPEDVRRHNEALNNRYPRAYNRISDGGTVEKVFWKR